MVGLFVLALAVSACDLPSLREARENADALPETSFISTVAATRLDLQDALTLASHGALTVPVAGRYPLDGINDALDALRARAVLGRQVLDITA